MRIGLLTTSFPRAEGDIPGLFVLGFARALADLGHTVHVLAPEPREAAFVEPPAFPSVHVEWVRYLPRTHEHTFYGAGVLDNLRRDPRATLGLLPFVAALYARARERVSTWDALVSHWALPCAVVAGLVRGERPHLAVLHSADVHVLERLPRVLGLAAQIARSADSLVFSSRDLRRRFLSRLGPLARADVTRRAHVSAMGIAPLSPYPKPKAALRRELGLSQLTVLSLGRLVPIKGIASLIDAVSELDDVQLIVAGDGPERVSLTRRAAALGGRVRFVGEVRGDDKARLLHAADVFALPSVPLRSGRTEGMPTSVLEAMQHGLPVIASDTGGVSDLITHGDNGLLVPAGDPHALAAAIATLRTASTRHKLARRAQRTAADFEWPALGPFFERLLRSGSAF